MHFLENLDLWANVFMLQVHVLLSLLVLVMRAISAGNGFVLHSFGRRVSGLRGLHFNPLA